MPPIDNVTTVLRFPKFPPGEKVYIIGEKDARLNIENLHIPSGYKIVISPEVNSIEWSVRKISFGEKAIIDISYYGSVVDKPAPAQDLGGQADHGDLGAPGNNGSNGAPGHAGVSLTIINLEEIENDGSLWIRTNGQNGGEGGDGGGGRQGGGPRNKGLPIFGKKAARGGHGGHGGSGGKGGDTSTVKIKYLPVGLQGRFVSGCANQPVGEDGPPGWEGGNTGVIAIYGGPGQGGRGGRGGRGGAGGDKSVSDGDVGSQGPTGPAGACVPVETTRGT
ncbi:hypothetical protein [Methylobacterium sp. Leaf85]|uniref:hypothetical protein n=1 Tax=Methylobacterium sp. Leaf85 TaxID=1736241 RepID=UPI000AA17203|nr:hypothetical protein [Methylobacterium sp. Leaf85]